MHSRKPADSASCGRGKNLTFSRRGRRDGHDGRQYTPVDDTANTNLPSLAPSRATTDRQRTTSTMPVISTCLGISAGTFSLSVFIQAAYDLMIQRAIRILRSKRFSSLPGVGEARIRAGTRSTPTCEGNRTFKVEC